MLKKDGYYIVVNRNRGPARYPYTHHTYNSALQEAKRLARENPGAEFIVMASIQSVIKDDMTFFDARPPDLNVVNDYDDEIPF